MTAEGRTALLPCPFCDDVSPFVEREDYSACSVQCNKCLARGPVAVQESDEEEVPGEAGAIAAWNQRAAPPVPTEGRTAWVLVPRRMNSEQMYAAIRAKGELTYQTARAVELDTVYTAFINAAPAAPPSEPICKRCGGSGEVPVQTHGAGPDDYESAACCPSCNGTGAAAPPVAQPSQTPIAWFKHTGDPNIDTAVDMCWGKTPPQEGSMWNPLFATPVAQAEPLACERVYCVPDDDGRWTHSPTPIPMADNDVLYYASPPDPLTLIRLGLEAAAKVCEHPSSPASHYGQGIALASRLDAEGIRNLDPAEILAGVQPEGTK